MYKIASDKSQDGARRLKLHELQSGPLTLTLTEEYESLRAAVRRLDERLCEKLSKEERKILGAEKRVIADRITALRPQVKTNKNLGVDLAEHFLEVVRESATKAQFHIYMNMARARFDAQEAAKRAGNEEFRE